MKKDYTDITFIVDRSGSMFTIAKDMEIGMEKFIKEQKDIPGECRISLVQFDDKIEKVFSGLLVETIDKIKLEPRGWTALYDAIGYTINETGKRLKNMKESERPEKVVMFIITDGAENYSKEFKAAKIEQMITHQKDKYSWEFVFLGANQDSIFSAKELGISNNVYNYTADSYSVNNLWSNLSRSTTSYRKSAVSQTSNYLNLDVNDLTTGAKNENN